MSSHDPAYVETFRRGLLRPRIDQAAAVSESCELCPRRCRVDRRSGEKGVCRTGKDAIVSSVNPHFGEESPLVGRHGSGTIFFTHCNLLCRFCQNYEISHQGAGRAVTDEGLAAMMLALQAEGCHNINFVTPTHVVPQILAALEIAAGEGLRLPLVYNTGGYDRPETLRLLDGVVDLYMPDFKFWDAAVAEQACGVPDYPERARQALAEMHRQVGDLVIDADGIARRGLLVRHLVLPGGLAGTGAVMGFIAETLSPRTYVNVMSQYRPCGRAHEVPGLDRPLSPGEYRTALAEATAAGITRLDRPHHAPGWR
jgi:putative pyruvate formate lyase activating enzyme